MLIARPARRRSAPAIAGPMRGASFEPCRRASDYPARHRPPRAPARVPPTMRASGSTRHGSCPNRARRRPLWRPFSDENASPRSNIASSAARPRSKLSAGSSVPTPPSSVPAMYEIGLPLSDPQRARVVRRAATGATAYRCRARTGAPGFRALGDAPGHGGDRMPMSRRQRGTGLSCSCRRAWARGRLHIDVAHLCARGSKVN